MLIIYNTLLLTVAMAGWFLISESPLKTPVDVLCLSAWIICAFIFWCGSATSYTPRHHRATTASPPRNRRRRRYAVIYDIVIFAAFSHVSDVNFNAVIKASLPVFWIGRKCNVFASYAASLLLTASPPR